MNALRTLNLSHNDLKLENIFITEQNIIKIGDLG
jgi:serine/threonine protein kinase